MVLDANTLYTDGAHNVVISDLDADGRPEIVANAFRSDALMFYQCDGDVRDPNQWQRHVVDVDVSDGFPTRPIHAFAQSLVRERLLDGCTGGAHYTAISDLSGDGMADLIVAGDLKKCDVVYYETRGESESPLSWVRHCIYRNDSHRTYQVEAGDVDGDGACDVVFTTKTDSSLGWCQNRGPASAWPMTWIATNLAPCFYARVADLDRDGRSDVVATQDTWRQGGRIYRFAYAGDPSHQDNWTAEVIAEFPPGHGASVFEIVDLDRDGSADIFVANHQGDVFLLRSSGGKGRPLEWAVHRLNEWDAHRGHNFREVDVGDIDGDGDLDVVLADEHLDLVMWLENPGESSGQFWPPRVIDKSRYYLLWCHCVDLGDVDGDGDLDLAVAACGGNVILLYLNRLSEVRPSDEPEAPPAAASDMWPGLIHL
ncbi:MAG: FG-GAP repeat domain-containing protein [Planctomycetota bacterium]